MRRTLGLAALLLASACATNAPPPRTAGAKPDVVSIPKGAFPSTYKPYPGVTTVITGATKCGR